MLRSLSLMFVTLYFVAGCNSEIATSKIDSPLAAISIAEKKDQGGKFEIVDGPAENIRAITYHKNLPFLEAELLKPLKTSGTVAMWFKTDKPYRSTFNPGTHNQNFLMIHELAQFGFYSKDKGDNCPAIYMYWHNSINAPGNIVALLPEIPGDSWIHIAFTWDSKKGLSNAYINGTPLKGLPDVPAWKIKGSYDKISAITGDMPVSEVKIYDSYLTADQIAPLVLEPHKGAMDKYMGATGLGTITDSYVNSLKGELAYENKLAAQDDISSWVMEGPGKIDFADKWMIMKSTEADEGTGIQGHIVNWCDRDMSENFVAQWDFQMRSDYGLCIAFFCAKGVDGQDIFSPELKPRDGGFKGYIKSDINNYHISYQASTPNLQGRATSHLRKNTGFALAANGPIGVPAGSKDVHKITLIKNGSHIQMAVDGRLIIDFTEDGSLNDVHGSGKIGFRQMKWTTAAYRNFKVYNIK